MFEVRIHGRGGQGAVTAAELPVEEYLRPQGRYAHLFGEHGHTEVIARIQAIADRNFRRFGLIDDFEVPR